MSRYQRHVFVCINERPPDHPKGCCHAKGSAEIRDALKEELKKRGLAHVVRANNAGCLDACEYGVTMVVYPDGVWYGGVKKEDIEEIIDRTIINGEVIQRLLIPNGRYAPDALQFPKLRL
ncbi:MAG: (2Fe-2S) ferredoxin domain-containing protein [Ignavibacteriae bacterium]|nr:(2Fe-2S) ferredoxin domain-containing protein [Ignavibacteriota bacterium]